VDAAHIATIGFLARWQLLPQEVAVVASTGKQGGDESMLIDVGRRVITIARMASIVIATLAAPAGAWACSCFEYDPALVLSYSEIIVDGVVTERDPLKGEADGLTPKTAKMRVETVWKGDVEPIVTLHFHEASAACGSAPPVGERIRFSSYGGTSTELYYGSCGGLPFDDPVLDRILADYKRRTDEVARRTGAAGRLGQLEFAQYLRANGEFYRAMIVYRGLKKSDPTDLDAVLGEAVLQAHVDGEEEATKTLEYARSIAAPTDESRGKIARAEFEALGNFDAAWKDWSNLENVDHCNARWQNFDGAVFDGARLNRCRFVGSSLRGASFKGADLVETDLSGTDLTGAKFDCDTRFEPGFRPAAAGMLNLDGTCN
jgi:hypothetical protein